MYRCKTEDAAWSQLIQSYNNRQAEVVTLLAAKAHAASASAPGSSTPSRSGKARPSRAAMEEDWIRELEQDPHWHTAVSLTRDEGKVRAGGLENDLAAESDTESDDGKQLAARLEGLELQVCIFSILFST